MVLAVSWGITMLGLSTVWAGPLDDTIAADCAAAGLELPTASDNATFLRRVYLDCIGRIPELDEARAFLDSADPDKRAKLIDELLNSEGYAKHWFHFWADLLRVSTDVKVTRSGIVGSAYVEWIQNALDENRPYDLMVRDLVGRQGNVWEPENAGAAGFYLRDFAMPLEHFGILMRVFAGTRMECAQCHNHPFDRWTQRDFHQLAAFTFGVRASKYPDIYEQTRGADRTAVNKITIPMRFASVKVRSWPLKLPHDYAYDDAEPGDEVAPKFVFGPVLEPVAGDSSSAETFARWLTDAEHPRFTRVIVNRLWTELFGAPLVPPPLDDLRDDTAAWNSQLEAELMAVMRNSGYDMRGFLATVMKSQAYQRQATAREYQPGERQYFEAPYVRRMSAEQVWDSLVTLITDDAERPNFSRRAYRERYLHDLRVRAAKVCEPEVEQVRAWLQTSAGKAFVAQPRTVNCAAADAWADQREKSFQALDHRKPLASGTAAQFNKWKSLHSQLYRAIELETPMPPGHFLRTFGQSDRELPNNSNRSSSVPQSLAVFNDELSAAVANPWSPVMRAAQSSEARQRTNAVFLSILSRRASEPEHAIAKDESPEDLAAALLATAEFFFVR
jgi:hypothetical protein